MNATFDMRLAYTQATYTLTSHLSMYHGLLPSVRDAIPYYNRFCKPLFRLAHRDDVSIPSFMSFGPEHPTIVHGLRSLGYSTITIAAMEWFHSPLLQDGFEHVHHTGIHAEAQIRALDAIVSATKRPVFCVLNLGETHEPYRFGGLIQPTHQSRARARSFESSGFDADGWHSQIKACSYLDSIVERAHASLIRLGRPLLSIVCADHGECFGEDRLYGHGFYHPLVMTVPLGIRLP